MKGKSLDLVIIGTSILVAVGAIAWIKSSVDQQTRFQVETVTVQAEIEEFEKQIGSFESEIPKLDKRLDSIEAKIEQTLKKRKLAETQLVELIARYKELQSERNKADELTAKVEAMLENTIYMLERITGGKLSTALPIAN